MRKLMTVGQKKWYWQAFDAACFELGLVGREEREDYRHRAMVEACGKKSVNEMNSTTDFDAVMSRFAIDARDFEHAAKFAVAGGGRVARIVSIECSQILQLKDVEHGEEEAWRYLCGVLDQSRIANGRYLERKGYWLDIAPQNINKLLQILDTHRRRLIERLLTRDNVIDTLRFFDDCRYTAKPYNRIKVERGYYDDDREVVVNLR